MFWFMYKCNGTYDFIFFSLITGIDWNFWEKFEKDNDKIYWHKLQR